MGHTRNAVKCRKNFLYNIEPERNEIDNLICHENLPGLQGNLRSGTTDGGCTSGFARIIMPTIACASPTATDPDTTTAPAHPR